MNKILFFFLFLPLFCAAQFTPRNLTARPYFFVAGQSNAENFWNANLYSSSTIQCAERLEDSLQTYWGIPAVHSVLTAAAGKGLAVIPTDVDWNTKSENELYDNFGRFYFSDPNPTSFNIFINEQIAGGFAPSLRFILWIQGETDASDANYANAYYNNIVDLVRAWRQDFKDEDLPVVIVKLNPTIPRGALTPVRAAQQQIADEDPNVYVVNIDDFQQTGIEYNGPTNVHYSENGLLKILERVVNIAKTL